MSVVRCKTSSNGELPHDAVGAFHRDGVLIVDGFKSRAECERLRERANALVEEHGPRAAGTIFSTKAPQHLDSRYFMRSATGIGVFFEEEAFDADGKLAYPLPLAVNKLGHASTISTRCSRRSRRARRCRPSARVSASRSRV